MACGIILPDGRVQITHPDINISEIIEIIKDIQREEASDETLPTCQQNLLNTFVFNPTIFK